jgi:primase-polymerase (primpol)-like protein
VSPTKPPDTLPVRADGIPPELRECPQWVCWAWEWRTDAKGQLKLTKPPLNPAGGYASTTDPSTWSTFERARDGYLVHRFGGIGFVLADDPYFGVDVDHVVTNGTVDPWAAEIVAAFGSYTEITPSGTGLRVFGRGRLPGDGHNKRFKDGRGLEVYHRARFLTLTGQHLPGTPATIIDAQVVLDALLAEYWPEPEPVGAPAAIRPTNLDDLELLRRAGNAANGGRFAELWAGNWEDAYGSHSEADLALAGMLCFWTGGDLVAVDRLFRQSGLMRRKWDEHHGAATYGQTTLTRALTGRTEFYRPPERRHEAMARVFEAVCA